MSQMFGILRLVLLSGAKRAEFEKFISEEAFPAAAEAAGVNRGGQSAIESQHLLKAEGDDSVYLWAVKITGALIDSTRVLERMYNAAQERLESFATLESSTAFAVLESFDAGPRDQSGSPTGDPIRGNAI